MKFICFTHGCKVNQYETQAMERKLIACGHTLAMPEEPCDIYIINTCTVTAAADRKNRTLIRRLRAQHPQAVIGVCGCYAQVSTQQVRDLGVDVISGSGGQEEFLQMILHAAATRDAAVPALDPRSDSPDTPTHGALVHIDDAMRRRTFEPMPAGGLSARTRAMLKVQDGCSNFCTYCIIPYARGPVRSLALLDALAQADAVVQAGYKELVLTGIEIASWGRELKDGSTLVTLVSAVCGQAPQMRIRLGSLEPRIVDEAFCRTLSAYQNLCPQFHLSLQSGSDSVLRRMHRKYDTARYFESVARLRRWFPGCAVTTDLIVGFPGETQEEFMQSLEFVRRCAFASMHIFPYSRRDGTPAAAMPDQIAKTIKTSRAAEAAKVAQSLRVAYNSTLCPSEQVVLFEQEEDGFFSGHAMNGVKVFAKGTALQNQVRRVQVHSTYLDGVLAEIDSTGHSDAG